MTSFTRRQLLGTAAAAALTAAANPAVAIEPIKRTGPARIGLSLAAYSYRDYLQNKAEPHMTMEDFIDRAAQMELDAVELTQYYFPNPLTREYLASIKRKCYLLGLAISGAPVGNTFTLPAGPTRDAEIARVKAWIDNVALLGAPSIRVFAGNAQKGQSLEDAQKCAIECLEICCDYAGKSGIILAVENHGGIVATPDSLLKIVKAVQSPWCGINLDTGNFRTADPYADIEKCLPYAVIIQVKTEIAPGGKKVPADLKREIEMIKKSGYRGYVALEYEAAERPLDAVPRTIRELRSLI